MLLAAASQWLGGAQGGIGAHLPHSLPQEINDWNKRIKSFSLGQRGHRNPLHPALELPAHIKPNNKPLQTSQRCHQPCHKDDQGVRRTFPCLGSDEGMSRLRSGDCLSQDWGGLCLTCAFSGLFSHCLKFWDVYPSVCNSAEVWVFYS